jgi:hypothetical protein
MLAQAEAAIFRMFFEMLFGIVLFGMPAGILVFPALMSLIGQAKLPVGDRGPCGLVVQVAAGEKAPGEQAAAE